MVSETAVHNVSIVDPGQGTVGVGTVRCVRTPGYRGPNSIIDGTGLFVIPGLIDMHVHICGGDPTMVDASAIMDNLAAALRAGTTTVRDLGGSADLVFAVRGRIAGNSSYPRVFTTGSAITAPGGHGVSSGLATPVADSRDARRTVARLIKRGADVIKVMAGSGSAPSGFPELTVELMRDVVEEAHRRQVPVAIHANFRIDHITRAIDAGCDTLEHGTMLCDLDADRLSQFAAHGGACCPTLSVLEKLRTTDKQDEVNRMLREAANATWQKALDSVAVAQRTGISVVAGTDAGARGVGFGTVAHEVSLLEEAGLSRLNALRASTTTAMRYLRYPNIRHPAASMSPTNRASDVILLSANPFEDLSALNSVIGTISGGVIVHLKDAGRRTDGGRG